jgi:hypothetical protein
VACFLQVGYFDAAEAQASVDDAPKLARYRIKRQAQAHQNYISAIAALATIRKLLPAPIAAPMPGDAATTPLKNCRCSNGQPVKARLRASEAGSKNRVREFFEEVGTIGVGGCGQRK